jgi:hypothetical protein
MLKPVLTSSFLLLGACGRPPTVDFGDPAQLSPLDPENLADAPVLGAELTLVSGQRGEE